MLQWLPESARFDMTRGNRTRALATLERIAQENGKSMPLGKLVEPSLKVEYQYLPTNSCDGHFNLIDFIF